MHKKDIITRQRISPELFMRAKEFRRQMTPAERKLWQSLSATKLGGHRFRRQQIIGRYIVDFYCHKSGLVVEVDGKIHLDQKGYDQERDAFLASLGLIVLRFTNEDVELNLESVLGKICEACDLGENQ